MNDRLIGEFVVCLFVLKEILQKVYRVVTLKRLMRSWEGQLRLHLAEKYEENVRQLGSHSTFAEKHGFSLASGHESGREEGRERRLLSAICVSS